VLIQGEYPRLVKLFGDGHERGIRQVHGRVAVLLHENPHPLDLDRPEVGKSQCFFRYEPPEEILQGQPPERWARSMASVRLGQIVRSGDASSGRIACSGNATRPVSGRSVRGADRRHRGPHVNPLAAELFGHALTPVINEGGRLVGGRIATRFSASSMILWRAETRVV